MPVIRGGSIFWKGRNNDGFVLGGETELPENAVGVVGRLSFLF